jgi:hypothetical protein
VTRDELRGRSLVAALPTRDELEIGCPNVLLSILPSRPMGTSRRSAHLVRKVDVEEEPLVKAVIPVLRPRGNRV